MEMKNIIDEIYYSKEYQLACRTPSEKVLFLQWILDLVCLTEALRDVRNYDRWYMQLFYIKLAGLFEAMRDNTSINSSEDTYIQKTKKILDEIYHSLSEDEYVYIIYRRDGAAHSILTRYEIFNESEEKIETPKNFTVKGEKAHIKREYLDRAIGRVLGANGNIDKNCDIKIVSKLSPIIMQLKDEALDNFIKSMQFF